MAHDPIDRLLAEVERARDELVDFAAELIRIPTVNPPGACYSPCARAIGRRLRAWGMATEYVEATGRPEHTSEHPRVNVIGRLTGAAARPCLHLNGHFDVVPAGEGWTVDPFGGLVRGGRLYGRGASDMKSGLAAAAIAVEAVRRSGIPLRGSVEVSGTVDEESGGLAGVGHLCEVGRISAARTDYVIIPEPFGPDRICIGHKGVYWFDVTADGRVAHGSMPHLGQSAIDDMAALIEVVRTRLAPRLASRERRPEPLRRRSMRRDLRSSLRRIRGNRGSPRGDSGARCGRRSCRAGEAFHGSGPPYGDSRSGPQRLTSDPHGRRRRVPREG
jgi:succinyl-diaminopimelate desuccinylase